MGLLLSPIRVADLADHQQRVVYQQTQQTPPEQLQWQEELRVKRQRGVYWLLPCYHFITPVLSLARG